MMKDSSKRAVRVLSACAVVCAMMISWSAAAVAQGNASAEPVTHWFEVDEVPGAFISPGDEAIVGRAGVKTMSLITVRANFIPEILTSVEDVGP